MRTPKERPVPVALVLGVLLIGAACTSAPSQKKISASAASPSTEPATSVASPHQEQSCKGNWHVLDTPNPNPSGNLLVGIDAVAPNNVWAVGGAGGNASGELTSTLILHWDGREWAVVDSPSPGSRNELNAVDGHSANDVWAVGFASDGGPPRTLTLHWDGSAWTEIPSPDPGQGGNYLYGVAALSRDDVWAVGASGDVDHARGRPLIEHWDGRRWAVAPSAKPGAEVQQFSAASAASPNDVWAVGFDGSGQHSSALIERWDGRTWQLFQAPERVGPLHQVTAVASNDVWAAGDANILHWDGREWKEEGTPHPPKKQEWHFAGLGVLSRDDLWAVGFGFFLSGPPGETNPIHAHWNGHDWKTLVGPGLPATWLVSASVNAGQAWVAGFRSGREGIMQTFVQVCR